ncbi:MAG TPA: biotin/lipoate A/B protein ligase family protein [Thermomicrobiales bacterium]|nr:biotin/lipoate A/B protein ligase family protein [Thermomicrobiales bacterium]
MTTEHEALYPAEVEARWQEYEWELIPAIPEVPPMNLALDEVLTKSVGRGERRPTLRFWGWSAPCVVLGRFQSVRNEVQIDHAREDGIQLVRRISGGGAMFIEPPLAITYSIHVPPAFVEGLSFPQSYAFFDSWVIEALRELGIDAWYAPLNDITSAGGKIGGAAQARRFGGVLHHTTMAYDMNIPAMMRTLRIGQEKLSDKGLRSADKRVGPLRQQTNLPRETIIERMSASFTRRTNAAAGAITVDERSEAEELVTSKFATEEWTYLLP